MVSSLVKYWKVSDPITGSQLILMVTVRELIVCVQLQMITLCFPEMNIHFPRKHTDSQYESNSSCLQRIKLPVRKP
jgi:hypothetical protein